MFTYCTMAKITAFLFHMLLKVHVVDIVVLGWKWMVEDVREMFPSSVCADIGSLDHRAIAVDKGFSDSARTFVCLLQQLRTVSQAAAFFVCVLQGPSNVHAVLSQGLGSFPP